jgi:hypothetical protein
MRRGEAVLVEFTFEGILLRLASRRSACGDRRLSRTRTCPELLLTGFLRRPVSLQFCRQPRFSCPTHCLLLGLRSRLTESAADLTRRRFAQLAFCAAAIFLFTEALMPPLLFGAAPDGAGVARIARSSLLRASICSLIVAARLSWVTVRSSKFMGTFINIQSWKKSSSGQMLLAGDDACGCYPSNSFPDDRLATSNDTGRQQITSEQVVPLATDSPR